MEKQIISVENKITMFLHNVSVGVNLVFLDVATGLSGSCYFSYILKNTAHANLHQMM